MFNLTTGATVHWCSFLPNLVALCLYKNRYPPTEIRGVITHKNHLGLKYSHKLSWW